MQIISGSKKQVALMEHQELIKKYLNRATDAAICFYRFGSADDLDSLIEKTEKLLDTARQTKRMLDYCDKNGIT